MSVPKKLTLQDFSRKGETKDKGNSTGYKKRKAIVIEAYPHTLRYPWVSHDRSKD
jgi:hypothetical protein